MKEWVILCQRHAQGELAFPRVTPAEVRAALPRSIWENQGGRLDIGTDLDVGTFTEIPWRRLQREQATRWAQFVATRPQHDFGLAYFGLTFVPLAVDLGARVGTFAELYICQRHHRRKDWRWETDDPTPAAEPIVRGLPEAGSDDEGDVVIRVATSYAIAPSDTREVVGHPLAEVDIVLRGGPDRDALAGRADIGRIADVFRDVLSHCHALFSRASLHLFLSVPVGLAFRLGTCISPTVDPPVWVYKYVNDATPRYRKALRVGHVEHLVKGPIRLLFFAAGPREAGHLRSDQELRDIVQAIQLSDHSTRFAELKVHLAQRVEDIQSGLRRAKAHILHFSGHGDSSGAMLIEDSIGRSNRIQPDDLRALIEVATEGHDTRGMIVNACYSHLMAAELLRAPAVLPWVVATTREVDDRAAIRFATGFYRALAEGRSVWQAFQAGVVDVRIDQDTKKWAGVFVIDFAEGVDPDTVLFDPTP